MVGRPRWLMTARLGRLLKAIRTCRCRLSLSLSLRPFTTTRTLCKPLYALGRVMRKVRWLTQWLVRMTTRIVSEDDGVVLSS